MDVHVNVLLDSFTALLDHGRLILVILVIIVSGQVLIGSVLKMIFRDRLDSAEYYSLSVAGWIIPALLASSLWLVLGRVLSPASSGLILLTLLVTLSIVLFLRTRRESLPSSNTVLSILLAFFGLFIFLRLAFLARAVIPLYFDSAQHYLMIQDLIGSLTANDGTSFRWPSGTYYHIGFHLLTAWLASTLGAEITSAMLAVGQMLLAALPFGIFLIIRQETGSGRAGIFAVLLAAFGWYMPAYAVNWGKYPALSSLLLIPFVLSLAYLSLRYKATLSPGTYLGLNVILGLGIVLTGFLHSRSLVIFGMVALAWITATGWQRLPNRPRLVALCAVLLALVLEISFIRTKDVFNPLFDPYWNQGLFVTAIVLFLSLFALRVFPGLAFATLIVILLLLGAIFVPITLPNYGNLTLLDRPFVEMILYLPLSYLGGAGLAGLEQSLQPLTARFQAIRSYLSLLFIGLLAVNALASFTLYPSDCCSIVGRDDLAAIDWMDKNLPPDARVLISSTEVWVLASDSFQGAVGGDAGAWITPLTGRATILLPYYSDFSQPTTIDILCEMDVGYIYVGEMGANFNSEQIAPYPNTYKTLLAMHEAKIYQVTACQ